MVLNINYSHCATLQEGRSTGCLATRGTGSEWPKNRICSKQEHALSVGTLHHILEEKERKAASFHSARVYPQLASSQHASLHSAYVRILLEGSWNMEIATVDAKLGWFEAWQRNNLIGTWRTKQCGCEKEQHE